MVPAFHLVLPDLSIYLLGLVEVLDYISEEHSENRFYSNYAKNPIKRPF